MTERGGAPRRLTQGPRWERLRPGRPQSGGLMIDPLVHTHFSGPGGEGRRAAVLVELKAGIRPRDLRKPPKGLKVSQRDWEANLSIMPAYVDGPAAHVLEEAGVFTGFATGRFFRWLAGDPALQALIKGVALSTAPAAAMPFRPRAKVGAAGATSAGALGGAKVVLALIDDWVSVANQRFRTGSGGTRCINIWLQGVDGVGQPPPGYGYGRELKRAEIDALLAAAGPDEEAFERSLYAPGKAEPTQRFSHGTHVADLFAGYGHAPAAEAKDGQSRPMICVALPRRLLPDTSGLSIINNVCDAVAYVIETMVVLGGSRPPPVVLNYSNGAMADIRHRLGVLRRAVTGMMEAYNRRRPNAPLAIVTPAGNSFQDRGHARLPRMGVPAAKRWPLDLRVLPDDRTPSYVTFELPAGATSYSLKVTPPGLPAGIVDSANPVSVLLDANGRRMAQLRFDPPALPDAPAGAFTLTIEPTADPLLGAPVGLAPHGVWRLEIGGPDAATDKVVHAFIARDVTLAGFPSFGRQSRFEDPAFEAHGRFGRPATTDDVPGCAIRRGGAMNVLGTDAVSGPVTVAARIARTDQPAGYSSAGGPLSASPPTEMRAPDVIADADHGEVLKGMLATGARTGSVIPMNGTSVAAPLVARAIADALAAGASGLPTDANAGRVMACRLAGGAAPPLSPPPDARRGHGRIATSGRRNLALAALRDS